jgi:deoxyribonucleoside regulator
MPRLNIYLPADLYEKASEFREAINLSEICARAIRDEIGAIESHRWLGSLTEILRPASELERSLARRYHLAEAVVAAPADDRGEPRELLGKAAASYLDRMVCDGALIAIAGGRQLWCVVQNLSRRRVRTTIAALGLHHADPEVLHVHPNTLTTLLWLLYSPRSTAHVIGATGFDAAWSESSSEEPSPRYFVISSCGPLTVSSPLAKLLGAKSVSELLAKRVLGDYAYVFFQKDGKVVEFQTDAPHSLLGADALRTLSRRPDARTILVAGGQPKVPVIIAALRSRLCNTLITDAKTAHCLLKEQGEIANE